MQYHSREAIYRSIVRLTMTCAPSSREKHTVFLGTFVLAVAIAALSISAPPAQAQANVQGTWQTLPALMPINPIHTALMSNGKILIVSGSGNYPQQTTFNVGVWDPSNSTMVSQTQSWDQFCNGMVVFPDGRPFIVGGNLQYDPFHGWNRTTVYDPATGKYTDMEDMAHGRWYPTDTILGDGRLMTFSGLDENGNTNQQVEIYTVGAGWAAPSTAPWTPPLYPRMHLLPNGKVFYSGWTTQSRTFDPSNNTWSAVIATTVSGSTRTYGSSVLLPLTPANNYKPTVLILGGGNPSTNTTELIDLSAATPAWVSGPPMSQPRIEMNATLLPTGKVLTVGGSLNDEDVNSASLQADLYDSTTNTMGSAGSNAFPRLYHSVALLLPDATVWVAGGNPTRGTYEQHIEIYTPPYLYKPDGTLATRPTITSIAPAPAVIGYGTSFTVNSPDAANIASVVLMKDGAATHAFDMEQRLVGLNFSTGSGMLNVTGPPNGNIAPPGYYMLFLINNAGVPSVANFVQVSPAPTDVPPVGAITSPATDVSIPVGGTVTFAGSGTASGSGTIAAYSWSFHGASPATSLVQNPGAVTFPAPGTYVASLTVTDNSSITDPSPQTRTITVTPSAPAPTLTNANPNTGAQGATNVNVVLTGTNFLASPACSFGTGIEVNSCTFNSATQITANIDILASAAVGARDIVVTDSDTQTATLPGGFTVSAGSALPAPTVTSATPNSQFQGATGVAVTLTGTNFQASPTCNFDADFGGITNTCTYVSPTQINAVIAIAGNAELGGHNVIVTNADGQTGTLINGFTVTQDLGNTVKLGAGFTLGALVLNGNAQLNGSSLEITDGGLNEDSSAWYATPVNVQSFATDFTFQITPGTTADGFTFALQNNNTAALGTFGGGLGYGPIFLTDPPGIANSLAIKFDLYNNNGEGTNSTGLYLNGLSPSYPSPNNPPANPPSIDLTPSGIDLHSGDIFAVHMVYDGTNLVMTLTDTVTNAVFTNSWPVDIPGTVGATTAYAGFTGGTGGLAAAQNIMTWTLGPLAPAVAFTPVGPVDFPDTTTNTTSAVTTITVKNNGTAPLHINATNAFTFAGTNPTDFAKTTADTCTGATVAVNATCAIGVTFTPSGTGTRQANLQIADDAAGSPQTLALTGNGVAPATPVVSLTPASPVMFPSTAQGVASSPVTVTVTNTGNAVLNISTVSIAGTNAADFSISSNTCNAAAVAANGACTVGIVFTPSATGPRQATFQVADDAAGSPQSVTLTGTGTAPTAPAVTITPAGPLTFPSTAQNVTSAPMTLSITNSGNAALSISLVAITGTNASDFILAPNTCASAPIAANGNCAVSITFTPSAAGSRQAALQVTDNATNSPQTVALSGTGAAPTAPAVTTNPAATLAFPNTVQNVTSASLPVTVTNSGNAPLMIGAVAVTGTNAGDFALATNTCTAPIAPNATCSVTLTFTPSAAGLRQASLQLTDNAANSPQSVALSGTGTAPPPPTVTITPTTLNLSATQGTTSASSNVTVTNSGSTTLTISSVAFSGTNVSEFANPTGSCPTPLAPNASCTIAVSFAPVAAMGSANRTETITITDNGANSPQTIAVTGSITYAAFSASINGLTATVNAGQTAQYSVQLTPGAGYSGSVTMACSGAPATTACTVSNPIQLSAGTAATFTVMVTTTARSFLIPQASREPKPPAMPLVTLILVIASAVLLGSIYQFLPRERFTQRQLVCCGAAFIVVITLLSVSGCASGGSSPGPTTGTQKGMYTLTLTPTATSVSGKPLQLTPIQLTLIVN